MAPPPIPPHASPLPTQRMGQHEMQIPRVTGKRATDTRDTGEQYLVSAQVIALKAQRCRSLIGVYVYIFSKRAKLLEREHERGIYRQ